MLMISDQKYFGSLETFFFFFIRPCAFVYDDHADICVSANWKTFKFRSLFDV